MIFEPMTIMSKKRLLTDQAGTQNRKYRKANAKFSLLKNPWRSVDYTCDGKVRLLNGNDNSFVHMMSTVHFYKLIHQVKFWR